jgi:hypothetical protein
LRDFILGLVVLALIAFSGIVAAQDLEDYYILEKEEKNMTFAMDQRVSGVGFFSTYRYALMPDLTGTEGRLFNGAELMKRGHGSGTISTESQLSAESTYTNTSHLSDTGDGEEFEILTGSGRDEIEVIDEYEEEATSVVSLKEDSNITHSPMAMAIGAKYYALHPITFKSLLSDETSVKNRDGSNSLSHRIEEAHGLDMALIAESDLTNTTINVDENLIDGKAHFGALQLAGIPKLEEADSEEEAEESASILGLAMKELHKPLVKVNTDYAGTYHIKSNMTLATSEDEKDFEDAWLPCCFGGYLDMPTGYQRRGFGSNVKALFDCSCSQVPSRAQFSQEAENG